jgi:hypothetical protein
VRLSDLRGVAGLATQATLSVSDVAEGVHRSVWTALGAPAGTEPGRTRGITGLVYRTVRGVTRLAGAGVDAVLAVAEPPAGSRADPTSGSRRREAVLGVLNGVVGDHLVATDNPLAIPMSLRSRGGAPMTPSRSPLPDATGKVLLLIHGLCMTDLQWHPQHGGRRFDLGDILASTLGYTPVGLRYNSGLHVSDNGRELSALLERLVTEWPTAVDELSVVAHSMGGLLIRSALHLAGDEGRRWPDRLKNIVFLGTPHHGAPLERVGSWVDGLLTGTPFTAPFAKLGRLRSAGITDLRYGFVHEDDWRGRDRFRRRRDDRRVVPLPEGVACYAVAATTTHRRGVLGDRLVGDGLVPVDSALGRHVDPGLSLRFPGAARHVETGTSHVGLLRSPGVARQVVGWLGRT